MKNYKNCTTNVFLELPRDYCVLFFTAKLLYKCIRPAASTICSDTVLHSLGVDDFSGKRRPFLEVAIFWNFSWSSRLSWSFRCCYRVPWTLQDPQKLFQVSFCPRKPWEARDVTIFLGFGDSWCKLQFFLENAIFLGLSERFLGPDDSLGRVKSI